MKDLIRPVPRRARPIDREALAALVAAGAVQLVEALGAPFFADVHLPGAVNIPPDRVDELAPRLIPDAEVPVVVYCSRTCAHAEATAAQLLQRGHPQVRVYPGGKEEWIEAGLPVERGLRPT